MTKYIATHVVAFVVTAAIVIWLFAPRWPRPPAVQHG